MFPLTKPAFIGLIFSKRTGIYLPFNLKTYKYLYADTRKESIVSGDKYGDAPMFQFEFEGALFTFTYHAPALEPFLALPPQIAKSEKYIPEICK